MTRDLRDIVGGAALALVGLFFLYHSFGYRFGTPEAMGPGFFPAILSVLTILVGLGIALPAFARSGTFEPVSWRPLFFVPAAILAFGFTNIYLGFIPAVMVTIGVSAAADREVRWVETLILAVACAIGAWLIFRICLKLPLPPFKGILLWTS